LTKKKLQPPLHPGRLRSWSGPTETDFHGRLRFSYDGKPVLKPDEENDEATARPSIDTCGWDPRKDEAEDGLSDRETVFACTDYDDDGRTFDDDIDVAGESSG
jgi:hypothetical protein